MPVKARAAKEKSPCLPAGRGKLPESKPGNDKSRTITALLVHINREILDLMRTVLEAKGLRVIETKNPIEGLNLIEKHCPDIVIHNSQMPLMDGVAFDRKIRQKYGLRNPKIIWISMIPLKTKHVRGCGVSAWIKPFFEPSEFAYFMEEILQER